jgi:hypothetical protein
MPESDVKRTGGRRPPALRPSAAYSCVSPARGTGRADGARSLHATSRDYSGLPQFPGLNPRRARGRRPFQRINGRRKSVLSTTLCPVATSLPPITWRRLGSNPRGAADFQMSQKSPEVTGFEFFGSGSRASQAGSPYRRDGTPPRAQRKVPGDSPRACGPLGSVGGTADRICQNRYNALPANWDTRNDLSGALPCGLVPIAQGPAPTS